MEYFPALFPQSLVVRYLYWNHLFLLIGVFIFNGFELVATNGFAGECYLPLQHGLPAALRIQFLIPLPGFPLLGARQSPPVYNPKVLFEYFVALGYQDADSQVLSQAFWIVGIQFLWSSWVNSVIFIWLMVLPGERSMLIWLFYIVKEIINFIKGDEKFAVQNVMRNYEPPGIFMMFQATRVPVFYYDGLKIGSH